MPQEQAKIERVPTFWEALLAEYFPNLSNPAAMEENAKLLHEGQGGDSPDKMAKVLQVAGHGLVDGAFGTAKSQVPQSAEEVALQYGPLGPAVGTAVSTIHPKYIKPILAQLKDRVLNNPNVPFKDLIEELIDRRPRVSAQIGDFKGSTNPLNDPLGQHSRIIGQPLTDGDIERALDRNLPVGPSTIMLNEPKILAQKMDPRRVLNHEATHVAQSTFTPITKRGPFEYSGDYWSRPIEIGARMGELPKGTPLSARLETVLNDPITFRNANPEIEKFRVAQLNRKLEPQGLSVERIETPREPVKDYRINPRTGQVYEVVLDEYAWLRDMPHVQYRVKKVVLGK